MTRYLLAAEADKIQDLIFRSARLREVVGGSQLLTRFCKEVPDLLLPSGAEVVVSDGGSFRIIFDDVEQAQTFSRLLAEVYHRTVGGSLTVADLTPVNGDFGAALESADNALRRAKRWSKGWQGQVHLPYMAFCASCGVGLALAHRAYHSNEESQYLCESCLNKGAERLPGELGKFLEEFYKVVLEEFYRDDAVDPQALKTFAWPGKKKFRGRSEIDPLEDIADYDPRRYVAYLLADGNDMGKVFGACRTPEQMHALSDGLSEAMRKALAVPTKAIMKNNQLKDRSNFIPVMPLIMGGDDLFALIPAPWALDFVRQFCQKYECELANLLERLEIQGVPRPTISAAVVICKSKYPYALAHEAGEERLKEAKRMGKQLVLDGKQPHSAINIEVVLGGRLLTPPTDQKIRPTLRPYWASEHNTPAEWGLPIGQIIDQRYKLRNIPHKRLNELQSLYDSPPSSIRPNDLEPWQRQQKRLLDRIKHRNEAQGKAVEIALKSLGGTEKEAYWRRVDRSPEYWHGHGLPDLLEVWDFALNLNKPHWEYEEG